MITMTCWILWMPRKRRVERVGRSVALAGAERVTATLASAPATATPARIQVTVVLTAEKRGEREAESRSSHCGGDYAARVADAAVPHKTG